MASKTTRSSVIVYPLGMLGLVLIGLTAWGVQQLQSKAGIARIPARFVLGGVSTVGWIVDRLPRRMVWSHTTGRPSAAVP